MTDRAERQVGERLGERLSEQAHNIAEAVLQGRHFITAEVNGLALRCIALDDARLLARQLAEAERAQSKLREQHRRHPLPARAKQALDILDDALGPNPPASPAEGDK